MLYLAKLRFFETPCYTSTRSTETKPREIQTGRLDDSSATKLPQENLVWQSGGQFDLGSLGQIALRTVLPSA